MFEEKRRGPESSDADPEKDLQPDEKSVPEGSTPTTPDAEFSEEVVVCWDDDPTDVDEGEQPESDPVAQPSDVAAAEAAEAHARLAQISSFLMQEFSEKAGDGEVAPAEPALVEESGSGEPEHKPEAAPEPQPEPHPLPELQAAHEIQPEVADPFFDIPEDGSELENEDAETSPPELYRGRGRRSAFSVVLSTIPWLMLFSAFVVLGAVLIYLKYARDRLYHSEGSSAQEFVITVNPRDTLGTIAGRLKSQNAIGRYMFVDDKYLMKYLAWINDNSRNIKPGTYRFNAGMSLAEIYNKLVQGSADFKITVREGLTVREVAALLSKRIEGFNADKFLQLCSDPSFIATLGLNVPTLEGYLYPSTYFWGPGTKEEDVIRVMVRTFRESVDQKLRGIDKRDGLSFPEHVVMASLIEREARVDPERPLIASVLYNRLRRGMRLQIDASVIYALAWEKPGLTGEWNRRVTFKDLETSSPYNTYRNKGLPPGPICNPGAPSVLATFSPAATDFLYYVYKNDGSHAFARTFEEHKKNVQLYRRSTGNSAEASDAVADSLEPPVIESEAPQATPTPASAVPAVAITTATQESAGVTSTVAVTEVAEDAKSATPAPSRKTSARKSSGESGSRTGTSAKSRQSRSSSGSKSSR